MISMVQKKLEPRSVYNDLDLNEDGVVDDSVSWFVALSDAHHKDVL